MACRASLSIARQHLPTVKWAILNSRRATPSEMIAHQFQHGLTVFMATLIGTALVFRTVQAIIKRGYLVDPSASNAKKYAIILRLTRLITYSIGLLALVPVLPTMTAYHLSGQLRITISQSFIPYRILTAASICVASLVLDLFARPTIHTSTLLHHVAACAIGALISDWNIGLEIGLVHLLASLLEIPTDLALVVEGASFDRITRTLWLEFGKWWFAIVKFLAQVPILMIVRRMLRASVETEGFVGRSVVLLVTVLLDGVLLWTHVLFFRSLDAKQHPKTTK